MVLSPLPDPRPLTRRVPISELVNVSSFGKKGLCRCNDVKDLEMRASWIPWVAPNPMTGVLRRGGQRRGEAT